MPKKVSNRAARGTAEPSPPSPLPSPPTVSLPFRTRVAPEAWYAKLDPGIRFAVRVLHAAGIETAQSCEGGAEHAYPEPSVDIPAGPADSVGFAALHALSTYGLKIRAVMLVWDVCDGLPYEKHWRVTLTRTYPERADEAPIFVWGVQAQDKV